MRDPTSSADFSYCVEIKILILILIDHSTCTLEKYNYFIWIGDFSTIFFFYIIILFCCSYLFRDSLNDGRQ